MCYLKDLAYLKAIIKMFFLQKLYDFTSYI